MPDLNISVWRSGSQNFETFLVPQQDSQTVLDVVSHIQTHLDPTLSYRFACRVGMCGSCAMMVNGIPRWTCRTHVSKVANSGAIKIEPLRNLPVVKDLITDMDPFFDKWIEAKGVFEGTATRSDDMRPVDTTTHQRIEANAAIECINCAVCYAACDTVSGNDRYFGPAALNRVWSLVNDEKDGGQSARLDAISDVGGCHNCHSQGSCSLYCPNELDPAASIASLKRRTASSFWQKR
ncbi:MAG: 2Fe-2S iron-sulfur cluster-binding protein [Pseudomonadota bacterium]